MYISHPAYPSRARLRALAAAEQRDEADLQTLESIAAILRRALAEMKALPALEHPEPTYFADDTVKGLEDELRFATNWAELLRTQPTLVEDEHEYEWDGEAA